MLSNLTRQINDTLTKFIKDGNIFVKQLSLGCTTAVDMEQIIFEDADDLFELMDLRESWHLFI